MFVCKVPFKQKLRVKEKDIMTEAEIPTKPGNHLKNIITFLLHPRQEYRVQAHQKTGIWSSPMLAISITFLVTVLVAGYLRNRAISMGEIVLPVDWQWWSSVMQDNYMQAVQATQGPAYLYVIPAVTGLTGIWLVWGIISGLLHLGSTLSGGRGTMISALNITAWSSLPFMVRDILRIIYMVFAKHPINAAGLSGFITGTEGGALFYANLLKHIDIFVIWQVLLLILGFYMVDSLPRGKAVVGVIIVYLIVLLAQAGLGTLGSMISGMIISRPF